MRYENKLLPSREESKRETKKRVEILKKVEPVLESFCEAVIVAGSMAYGRNYSVRVTSDIDLIVLLNRKKAEAIPNCDLFTITPQVKEGLTLFMDGEVDHFSVIEEIEGVEVHFHFWDKEVHFRAERFEEPWPKAYNIFAKIGKWSGTDFQGIERMIEVDYEKCDYGILMDYPPYFIYEGKLVLRQPLQNLIMDGQTLFTKDKRLFENIDFIWREVTRRFRKECEEFGSEGRSIMNILYGYWNFSPESRKKVEDRIKLELKNLGK